MAYKMLFFDFEHILKHPPQLYLYLPEGETAYLVSTLATKTEVKFINLSLDLSTLLLDLPTANYPSELLPILKKLTSQSTEKIVILDKLEFLFSTALKCEPLNVLKNLSRKQTIIAVWPGKLQQGWLIYAEPYHPEYKHYPADNLSFIRAIEKDLL